jgi:hypothetical protein
VQTKLETDYLIIGAGAMGMAFLDELIHSSKHRAIIVDTKSKPGGHWNNAYKFVRLHQPALFYGVNSTKLGSGCPEDLSTGTEVLCYYERVMEKLVATGRVRFLSQHIYEGDGIVRNLLNQDICYQITFKQKLVDATYSQVKVPSTHQIPFDVAEDIEIVPINDLISLQKSFQTYVVIGAGKTGIDAVLYLLDQKVHPDHIYWVVSNDAWMFHRDLVMPHKILKDIKGQFQTVLEAQNPKDIFLGFEKKGWFLRLDKKIWPQKFRCATINSREFEQILRIKTSNIIRKGRVTSITNEEMILEQGRVPISKKSLFIDCTACGLTKRPNIAIYEERKITLQPVYMCQQAFSSAIIAALEVRRSNIKTKNEFITPVPHPENWFDYYYMIPPTISNLLRLNKVLAWWMLRSRLNPFYHMPKWQMIVYGFSIVFLFRPAISNWLRLRDMMVKELESICE